MFAPGKLEIRRPAADTDTMNRVAESHQLSPQAFERLKSEYDDLTTRGRIEIAHKIEAARELGDLSENGDYHAAKEEQGKMEGRIAHLAKLIANAEIVELSVSGDDLTVQPGCVVSIRYEGDDEVEKYLLGSIEERREGLTVMSPGSPLGQVLVGAAKGDTVTFEAPGGDLHVTVVEIEI
jgi:transcription elongation factor GreA